MGRSSRILAGLATVAVALYWGPGGLSWIGFSALFLLGLSFLVGGLAANPGCEVTALPNLVLPPGKRLHLF